MPYRHRGPGRARRHRTPSEASGALLSRPSSGNDPIEWDVDVIVRRGTKNGGGTMDGGSIAHCIQSSPGNCGTGSGKNNGLQCHCGGRRVSGPSPGKPRVGSNEVDTQLGTDINMAVTG